MKKNKQTKINRVAFTKMSIEQPIKGAEFLEEKAKRLKKAKNNQEVVEILKDTLFLSEQTIYKDYYFL